MHVEKRRYSLDPWRIVDADGNEVWEWVEYPSGVNGESYPFPPFKRPMGYARKRDAVAALERILEEFPEKA